MIVFGIYCPETREPHTEFDPIENIHKSTFRVVSRYENLRDGNKA